MTIVSSDLHCVNLPEQASNRKNCAKLFSNPCINVILWPGQAQFMTNLSVDLQV